MNEINDGPKHFGSHDILSHSGVFIIVATIRMICLVYNEFYFYVFIFKFFERFAKTLNKKLYRY